MHGTTPPEPPQTARSDRRGDGPLPGNSIPGLNSELVLYVVVVLLIGLVTLISDQLGAGAFVSALQWLTIAYILSRGIAKASRVFET